MIAQVSNPEKLKIFSFFLFFLVCFQSVGRSKYFVLDEKSNDFELSVFTLNTESLYKINKEIRLFNLLNKVDTFVGRNGEINNQSDYDIILFSVLPDIAGNEDWSKIDLDTVRSLIIDFKELQHLQKNNTLSNFNNIVKENTKYFNSYKIVIKKGNNYYVSKNCLLQFYSVRNRPHIFTNVYGTINTDDSPISIAQFAEIFKATYPRLDFPLNRIGEDPLSFMDWTRDRREYFSKKLSLGGDIKGYQFWTYIDWTKHSFQFDFERGIDRFVYLPMKGIVGGSFDFYFYFHRKELPIKYTDFINNIKEEKVIIADIYK